MTYLRIIAIEAWELTNLSYFKRGLMLLSIVIPGHIKPFFVATAMIEPSCQKLEERFVSLNVLSPRKVLGNGTIVD
jgi:uncharacterized membrane protein (UPF0182 family)